MDVIYLAVFVFWVLMLLLGLATIFRVLRTDRASRRVETAEAAEPELQVLWAGLYSMDTSTTSLVGVLAMMQLHPWKTCYDVRGGTIGEWIHPIDAKCFAYVLLVVAGSGFLVALRYRIILEQWRQAGAFSESGRLIRWKETFRTVSIRRSTMTLYFACGVILILLVVLDYILGPSFVAAKHKYRDICLEGFVHVTSSVSLVLVLAAHSIAGVIGFIAYGQYARIKDTYKTRFIASTQHKYENDIMGIEQTCRTPLLLEASRPPAEPPTYQNVPPENQDWKRSVPNHWLVLLLDMFSLWIPILPGLLFSELGIVKLHIDPIVYVLLWIYACTACFWSFLVYQCT